MSKTDTQPEQQVATVRQQIVEQVAGEIHGIMVQENLEQDLYLLVHRSVNVEEIPNGPDGAFRVIDRRTVAVDLSTGDITVTANGLWTLPNSDILESEKRQLCRSITDTANPNDWEPVETAGKPSNPRGLDAVIPVKQPDEISQDKDRMSREPGISERRNWGYGGGPPPEVEQVADRLREQDLYPDDHLIRLKFGSKQPFDSPREPKPIDKLRGNYGIELRKESYGMVAIDIDHPDKFDAELPDTLEISSPHGSDEQRHLIFLCENKREIADSLGGAWGSQVPDWGELWVGRRYLVGPGSELSEYGCTEGKHESGEPGGCDRCTTPGQATYEIVNDGEIATVDAKRITGQLINDDEKSVTMTDTDPFKDDDDAPDTHEEALLETEGFVRCNKCDEIIQQSDAFAATKDGKTISVCRGGCN